MAFVISGMAQAGTFEPAKSTISISLGAINAPGPNAQDQGGGGTVTLSDSGPEGHDIAMQAAVWSTVNFGAGTSLYTGIPLITDIRVTVYNKALTATSDFTHVNYLSGPPHGSVGPALGGIAGLDGTMVLWAFGNAAIGFDLANVGAAAGGTTKQTLLGAAFTVTAGPWVTGAVTVTGITTNVLSYNGVTGRGITMRLTPSQHGKVLSTEGGFVSTNQGLPLEAHTVTIHGDNQLLSAASSLPGAVTLVSPMRVNTSPTVSGRVPGAFWMDLVFVPEPGTMLLLVTGAVGLVIVGRRQIRK
jgi:hypothetical protein